MRGKAGQYNVILGYIDETVALAACELAVRLVNDLVEHDEAFDFEAELDAFLRLAQRQAYGPSTMAILEEAVSRDIPWQRLNRGSLVQLGQGVHAKRFRATPSSSSRSTATTVAASASTCATSRTCESPSPSPRTSPGAGRSWSSPS